MWLCYIIINFPSSKQNAAAWFLTRTEEERSYNPTQFASAPSGTPELFSKSCWLRIKPWMANFLFRLPRAFTVCPCSPPWNRRPSETERRRRWNVTVKSGAESKHLNWERAHLARPTLTPCPSYMLLPRVTPLQILPPHLQHSTTLSKGPICLSLL